jgi:DNA-binding XRE family transcriptional regulator
MPSPPAIPLTSLGAELQRRRGSRDARELAAEIGISRAAYYRLERGSHEPTLDTALALARWLGWTVERVAEAAKETG